MINELETHPCSEHLKLDLNELSNLWMEVTNEIFEKHNILQDASHKYGEFRGLTKYIKIVHLFYYIVFLSTGKLL